MGNDARGEFSIEALYAALDAARLQRGLTWQSLTREINNQFESLATRPISASTVSGMRGRRVVEGDGVLQMLLWLGRTPESFGDGASGEGTPLPNVGPAKILRFDTKAVYEALAAERTARGISWQQVADEIGGLSASSLTRLSDGGRTAFPDVMRITRWLGRPAAEFTRASDG